MLTPCLLSSLARHAHVLQAKLYAIIWLQCFFKLRTSAWCRCRQYHHLRHAQTLCKHGI